jgi:hypothetical protein
VIHELSTLYIPFDKRAAPENDSGVSDISLFSLQTPV